MAGFARGCIPAGMNDSGQGVVRPESRAQGSIRMNAKRMAGCTVAARKETNRPIGG